MRINDTSQSGVTGLGGTSELTSVGRSSNTREQSASGDHVSLSNLSVALSSPETESPERAERLSLLKTAVASGQYTVDPQTVSASIIRANTKVPGA